MKITDEQLKKAFKLSESYGPTHDGLQVLQAVSRSIGGFYIILKSTKMKMYPVASYGKKEVIYLIYSSTFDMSTNDLNTDFQFRATSLKKALDAIKTLNKAV